jgi:SPP1 gp7 family putative phage head morphogenesis protein
MSMAGAQARLDKAALERFLLKREPKLARIVARFTHDLANAITYEQIRNALLSGEIDEAWMKKLRVAYSEFIINTIKPEWEQGVIAGGAWTKAGDGFVFDPMQVQVREWAQNRAASLVTDIQDQQRRAIGALVERAIGSEGMGVDNLAMVIRPIVGLYPAQVVANARYYERVRATMLKNHPKTPVDRIEARARKSAARYAEWQHRARAAMIARTELVTAYNAGRFYSVGQAVKQGLLPEVEKVWVTALDERVCDECKALEGVRVGYDAAFTKDPKKARYSEGLFPPLHPRCRCVVTYEEIEGEMSR